MKFLMSVSIDLLDVEVSGDQIERITPDSLRKIIAGGNKQPWDALIVDEELILSCEALIDHLAVFGPVVIVANPSDKIADFAEKIDSLAFFSPPLRAIDISIIVFIINSRRRSFTFEKTPLISKDPSYQKNSPLHQKKHPFIASSRAMKDIEALVIKLSQFSTTVTLTGESGTGKEVVARLLHESSNRSSAPFVPVNCGAIPEGLVESELFGHKRGSFTDATRDKPGLFEEANGGTLFLDEIGELPLTIQAKLLRALQEHRIRPVGADGEVPVDVRVVAATLKDLEKEVAEKRFREDLFYRLNVVSIHIPPLRDRPDDIPDLVNFFLKKHRKKQRVKVRGITPEAMQRLKLYPWRGNVRELENCIERAVVLCDGETIGIESLPPSIRLLSPEQEGGELVISDDEVSIKKVTREIEITLIQRALDKTMGNRTQAAKLLEISHRALLYKLKEYELD